MAGCGSPDGTTPSLDSPDDGGGSGGIIESGGAGSDGSPDGLAGSGGSPQSGTNPLGRERCQAPPGMGSPGTIEQAVALLNALPKPTSVACFVESLDRPLTAAATYSINSAQPAFSIASPRVFLRIGQLWLSIVIAGESSELLEFGYLLAEQEEYPRSIKGELRFPLPYEISASAPYDKVKYMSGTICHLCHFDERSEKVPGIDNAFSSVAFRPRAETYVSIDSLRYGAQTCDWKVEPARCELLSAVFDGGEVREEAFPAEMPTFF